MKQSEELDVLDVIMRRFLQVVKIIFSMFGLAVFITFPIWYLWNQVVPEIFHLGRLSYWQAFCLFYLLGLLVIPFHKETPKP